MPLLQSLGKNRPFFNYILWRIRHNKNFLVCVSGSVGSGKSYLSLRMGEDLDEEFDIRNVCFDGEEFMDLITQKTKKLKKGAVIIFDEFQETQGNLDYQTKQSKLINSILSTFRHKNFILIVTTPHFLHINASSRRLFHSRIQTISIDTRKQRVKTKPYLLQSDQHSGKIYRKFLRFWNIDEGIVRKVEILYVGKPSKELIKQYEAKKTAFTYRLNEEISMEFKREKEKSRGKNKIELTARQQGIVDYLKAGLLIPQIAKQEGITIATIYEHLKLIKKKGIKITAEKQGDKILRYTLEN